MRKSYKENYIGKELKDIQGLFTFENSRFNHEYNFETGRYDTTVEKYPCYYAFEYSETNKGFLPIKLYHENGVVVDCYRTNCLSSENLKQLKEAVKFFDKSIVSQDCDDKNNYGLLFYHCGYDGKMQSDLSVDFAKKGVYVF